jgi:hypothetical protein
MTDKNNASNEELRFQTLDFSEPPAPIEVHAYSKRAGAIIARGAANSQGLLGARRVPTGNLTYRTQTTSPSIRATGPEGDG